MPYVTIEEEVWVDLDAFDTDELIEELKNRQSGVRVDLGPTGKELIQDIYMSKHVRKQPYDHLVDQLIGTVLGKVL